MFGKHFLLSAIRNANANKYLRANELMQTFGKHFLLSATLNTNTAKYASNHMFA